MPLCNRGESLRKSAKKALFLEVMSPIKMRIETVGRNGGVLHDFENNETHLLPAPFALSEAMPFSPLFNHGATIFNHSRI